MVEGAFGVSGAVSKNQRSVQYSEPGVTFMILDRQLIQKLPPRSQLENIFKMLLKRHQLTTSTEEKEKIIATIKAFASANGLHVSTWVHDRRGSFSAIHVIAGSNTSPSSTTISAGIIFSTPVPPRLIKINRESVMGNLRTYIARNYGFNIDASDAVRFLEVAHSAILGGKYAIPGRIT